MRLLEFVKREAGPTEKFGDIEIIDTIKKECAPWIRATKGKPVFRSVQKLDDDFVYKKKVRRDRAPRAANLQATKGFDKWIKTQGGAPRLESISVSTRKFILGQPFVVYPIGKFKYSWVRCLDWNHSSNETGWSSSTPDFIWGSNKSVEIPMFSELASKISDHIDIIDYQDDIIYTDIGYYIQNTPGGTGYVPELDKIYEKVVKEFMINSNKDLEFAMQNKYETWVYCDDYYIVPEEIAKNTGLIK